MDMEAAGNTRDLWELADVKDPFLVTFSSRRISLAQQEAVIALLKEWLDRDGGSIILGYLPFFAFDLDVVFIEQWRYMVSLSYFLNNEKVLKYEMYMGDCPVYVDETELVNLQVLCENAAEVEEGVICMSPGCSRWTRYVHTISVDTWINHYWLYFCEQHSFIELRELYEQCLVQERLLTNYHCNND